jgi:hypothetical protein
MELGYASISYPFQPPLRGPIGRFGLVTLRELLMLLGPLGNWTK